MSDTEIMKLINAPIFDDVILGLGYLFRKYPRLMKYVVPCTIKGKEDEHYIAYASITANSPLYGLKNEKKEKGASFIWEDMFDYLWT